MSKLAIIITLAIFFGSFFYLSRDKDKEQPTANGEMVENTELTFLEELALIGLIGSGMLLYLTCPSFRAIANIIVGLIFADMVIKQLREDRKEQN